MRDLEFDLFFNFSGHNYFGGLAASFSKRGSPRKGPHRGSSLRSAGVRELGSGISKRWCSLGIARSLSPPKPSPDAQFSSYLGPSTASFPLARSVIPRSA